MMVLFLLIVCICAAEIFIHHRRTTNTENLFQLQKEITTLSQQKEKLLQDITAQNNIYENQLSLYKENIQRATTEYADTLEWSYQKAEAEHDNKIRTLSQEENNLQHTISQYQQQVDDLKDTLDAGARAQLREQEKKEKGDFYKLSLTSDELDDIAKLNSIKPMLHQPVILSKLIWTTYFQKQTNTLCNRVLGTSNKVCGIYKITDLITQQYYIGQSLDVAARFKQHIKCGLGIDAPPTNRLYKAMQKDGVWNFSFELMEQCDPSQLDEKEREWINLYSAYDYGMNETRGNKK